MQTVDATDFTIVLQKLGFEHDPMPSEWVGQEEGGGEIESWTLTLGMQDSAPATRKIELQLFSDGQHRVSHFLGSRMSTPPTSFTTPLEMIFAIVNEVCRKDHPPLPEEKQQEASA